MFLQKSWPCYGEPTQTCCPQEKTCSDARYKLTQCAKSAVNNLRPHAMCYENAPSQEMSGQGRGKGFRKAQILHQTSSVCLGVWHIGWASKILRAEPWWCGRFGVHVTSFILRELSYNLRASLRELLACWQNISTSHQHKQPPKWTLFLHCFGLYWSAKLISL